MNNPISFLLHFCFIVYRLKCGIWMEKNQRFFVVLISGLKSLIFSSAKLKKTFWKILKTFYKSFKNCNPVNRPLNSIIRRHVMMCTILPSNKFKQFSHAHSTSPEHQKIAQKLNEQLRFCVFFTSQVIVAASSHWGVSYKKLERSRCCIYRQVCLLPSPHLVHPLGVYFQWYVWEKRVEHSGWYEFKFF